MVKKTSAHFLNKSTPSYRKEREQLNSFETNVGRISLGLSPKRSAVRVFIAYRDLLDEEWLTANEVDQLIGVLSRYREQLRKGPPKPKKLVRVRL